MVLGRIQAYDATWGLDSKGECPIWRQDDKRRGHRPMLCLAALPVAIYPLSMLTNSEYIFPSSITLFLGHSFTL